MYTKTQLQILAIFFAHPGEEFYLSQLGELLGKKPGCFQRGINSLEQEGLLVSKKQGSQRFFAIHEKYALLDEIRSIIKKTAGVEALLRNFVNICEGIKTALIFGSYARDSLRPGSDIDLLLVVSDKNIEDDVISGLAGIERQIQREVNYTLYSISEFNERRNAREPFLEEILSGPVIPLKGVA